MAQNEKYIQLFEELYRDNYVKVYRLAFGLANRGFSVSDHRTDAEDITQEAFLRAFRSFHAFRGESSFFTWICRITINVANDYMKQRKQLPIYDTLEKLGCTEEDLKDPNPANDPESIILANEIRRICLIGFVECLPVHQKKALFLVTGLELPYKKAAEILQCTVGSLKNTLYTAKKRLVGFIESRCSLVKEANHCRCEYWVKAASLHGRIEKECTTNPPARITIPDKVQLCMSDVRNIYRDVFREKSDEAMTEMLKEGFAKKKWATFT